MKELISAFLFFLPAGLANSAPVLATKIPYVKNWNTPLDLGATVHGERIFGDNKTWRGLLAGIFVGMLVAWAEALLSFDRATDHTLWFVLVGGLMGFGALAGDAVKSYFKRRAHIAPGQSWFPLDQIDYILGGLLAITPFVQWYPGLIVRVIVIYFGLHMAVNYFAYLVGINKRPI